MINKKIIKGIAILTTVGFLGSAIAPASSAFAQEKMVSHSKKTVTRVPISKPTSKPQGVPAVVAVYAIPGIGEVALLATGAIAIGGAIYSVGSWLYDVFQSWFKADTADDIISSKKKGSIRREFPTEWLNKTLDEIESAAQRGDKNAKKAKKLLTDKRFDK
ncbi:hypothetical protein [Brevibacillus laterosporus]|uniref:hypothetical protein n=1 Tax=Brevibacillus laterosporus TaxID=1465 RepID=UPI000B9A508E|nr:hypothetical protein [Brevibacillus laterosporus]MCG7315952.1 hypothetical protein [Brevibacillus laterosporus]MED1787935.1 hypothetical protein [Brevibacillus laterosporus]